MMTTAATAQNAKTTKSAFNQVTTVSIDINADPAIIWSLLTNASDFTRWNSTVTMLEGEIKLGEKIRLMSVLDEKRVFKIKIKEMNPERSMTWGDGKGSRVFTLEELGNGITKFTMTEKIGGLTFPMWAKYLPPFEENFDQYASDLKKEAEAIASGS
jgi:uncharacterized protein YndB with AHSA1/START domain